MHGGLTVSEPDSCVLDGATISGGIDMSVGSLLVCNHSTIIGGINATGGTVKVGGLHAIDGLPLSGPCAGNKIKGHVTLFTVFHPEFEDNTMFGGLDLFNNGPAQVEGNHIHGALNCTLNFSVTNDGIKNSVTGPETGQCAGL